MRGFILIAVIAVVSVNGRPEAPGGYNYNNPGQGGGFSSGGSSFGGGGHSGGGSSFGGGGHSGGGFASNGGSSFGNGGGNGGFVSGSGFGLGGGSSAGGSGFGNGGFSGASQGVGQTIVQKHIYVHVPPPEDEAVVAQQQAFASAPRKHYKIIFIKAPSAPSYQQQAIAAQAQNSEKTLIYVLVKKPEEQTFDAPDAQIPIAPSKPEVYFIKYKTQKDAGAASFGGGASSGGFAGSSGAGFGSGGAEYVAPQNPQTAYGPPHKK